MSFSSPYKPFKQPLFLGVVFIQLFLIILLLITYVHPERLSTWGLEQPRRSTLVLVFVSASITLGFIVLILQHMQPPTVFSFSASQNNTLSAQPNTSSAPEHPILLQRILLASGDIASYKAVIQHLEKDLIELSYVENGLQAIQQWQRAIEQRMPYTLVLMDCEMTTLDGKQASQAIRAYEALHHLATPVCIIGLYQPSQYSGRMLETLQHAGMNRGLPKPLRWQDLAPYVSTNWLAESQSSKPVQPVLEPEPTAVTEKSQLDHNILEGLVEELGQDFNEIVKQFLHYAPRQVDLLKQALESSNYEEMRSKAHQFKGESRQLGADTLSSLCQQIEHTLKYHSGAQTNLDTETACPPAPLDHVKLELMLEIVQQEQARACQQLEHYTQQHPLLKATLQPQSSE